ncbi:site-2 protease family protein [Fontivita pretiosa]|uniref:site-2 protease family protein n=1 Tax=Fontivita pretiosa TaxID=2989684 RepID=UPI003D175399
MFLGYLSEDPQFYFAIVITVVVSICVHELAHGIVAIRLGDRTPVESGHMTLNPLVHMGPMAIVFLLLAGISWGSMPISPARLRGRYAPALVAAAGPASNVALAVMALLAMGLWDRFDQRGVGQMPHALTNARYLLGVFAYANFALAMFNLIPVPPLDGWRILANLSRSYQRMVESPSAGGMMVVLLVVLLLGAGKVIAPLAAALVRQGLWLIRGY